MPELDFAQEITQKLKQAIAEELCHYQRLVNRADRLSKKIMRTQGQVDSLKTLQQKIEQHLAGPQCSTEQWLNALRKAVGDKSETPRCELPGTFNDTPLVDRLAGEGEASASQLEKQYHQHRLSCELMHEYCEQSYEYLQLLRFQVEQLREAVTAMLSPLVSQPEHLEAILGYHQ